MADQRAVFVSHISSDAEVSRWLKYRLRRDFLGLFDVFVSSDSESVGAGDDWLGGVRSALDRALVLITLCSPSSIRRPWINFEIGAAWVLDKTIIPVCHGGLSLRDLPIPLSLRQGMEIHDPMGLRRLYDALAQVFGCRTPEADFQLLAEEAKAAVDAAARAVQDDVGDRAELQRRKRIAGRLRVPLESYQGDWRTLERLAAIAGVSDEEAAEVLYADPEIRFSRRVRDGAIIVGLKRRVGEG